MARRAQNPSRRAKRSRTLDDCFCCSQTPSRGAKSRKAVLRPCSISQTTTPSWGAKRPRTTDLPPRGGCGPRPLPQLLVNSINFRENLSSNHAPLFESDPIDCHGSRRDWANLGDGPAGLIAECVLAADVVDYVRFRAVCCPWRRCCDDPREHSVLDRRFHPRRWYLLRPTCEDACRCRLLNLSTGQFVDTHLPELRGNSVYGSTTEGLLVLLHPSTHALRLLNPLTRQVAELPPADTIARQFSRQRLQVRDIKVSGAGLVDGDRRVAIYCVVAGVLAVAKPGDESWTVLDLSTVRFFHGSLAATTSFAGRFYGVAGRAIVVLETRGEGQPLGLVVAAKMKLAGGPLIRMAHTVRLVDNDGELMLVQRRLLPPPSARFDYQVYRVDLDARKKKTTLVRSLGGRALFMTHHRAVLVSPVVFPSIGADTVYTSSEFDGENGAYRIADGSIEPYRINMGSELGRPCTIADYLSVCL